MRELASNIAPTALIQSGGLRFNDSHPSPQSMGKDGATGEAPGLKHPLILGIVRGINPPPLSELSLRRPYRTPGILLIRQPSAEALG